MQNIELAIGLATIGLTIVSLATAWLFDWLVWRRNRRMLTADLYDRFYTPENYRRVVAPVFRITLKLRAFEPEARAAYFDTLKAGWVGARSDPKTLLNLYVSPDAREGDPGELHFRRLLPAESFTEHEALTAFLNFWSKLHGLVKAGAADQRVVRDLFSATYAYYGDLLEELADAVAREIDIDAAPSWIEAVAWTRRTLR